MVSKAERQLRQTHKEFIAAVEANDVGRIRSLFRDNPSFDRDKATGAMFIPVTGGHLETTRCLLEFGADPARGASWRYFRQQEHPRDRLLDMLKLLGEFGCDFQTHKSSAILR